jgi:hypothetical protein
VVVEVVVDAEEVYDLDDDEVMPPPPPLTEI